MVRVWRSVSQLIVVVVPYARLVREDVSHRVVQVVYLRPEGENTRARGSVHTSSNRREAGKVCCFQAQEVQLLACVSCVAGV